MKQQYSVLLSQSTVRVAYFFNVVNRNSDNQYPPQQSVQTKQLKNAFKQTLNSITCMWHCRHTATPESKHTLWCLVHSDNPRSTLRLHHCKIQFTSCIQQQYTQQRDAITGKYRVTTCLENLEMTRNLTTVREMSGILLKVREMSAKKSWWRKVA